MNHSIPAPHRRRRFLVFDVETTGLLPKKTRDQVLQISDYPHILQLSFVIYDLFEHQIIRKYDAYIKVAETVEISEFVTNLTGITKEICQEKGKNIIEVLEQFYEAYMFCDGLVAHNMDFDETLIKIEIERNRDVILIKAPYCLTIFNTMYEKLHNIERYCTMKKGTDLCNIKMAEKNEQTIQSSAELTKNTKNTKKKWPKLLELYQTLFNGETPTGLHNSMADVMACLRCYLKMRHSFDHIIVKPNI